MDARVCVAGMGAVPWSRAVGAVSARLDGVGRDAALSWKLTAVMEPTTTEVTFLPSSIIFYLFLYSRPPFIPVYLADCPLLCSSVSPAEKSASCFVPCCPSPAESPAGSWLYWTHFCVLFRCTFGCVFVILCKFEDKLCLLVQKQPESWIHSFFNNPFGFCTFALINIPKNLLC